MGGKLEVLDINKSKFVMKKKRRWSLSNKQKITIINTIAVMFVDAHFLSVCSFLCYLL